MRGCELAEGGGRTESCLAPMAERRCSRKVFAMAEVEIETALREILQGVVEEEVDSE